MPDITQFPTMTDAALAGLAHPILVPDHMLMLLAASLWWSSPPGRWLTLLTFVASGVAGMIWQPLGYGDHLARVAFAFGTVAMGLALMRGWQPGPGRSRLAIAALFGAVHGTTYLLARHPGTVSAAPIVFALGVAISEVVLTATVWALWARLQDFERLLRIKPAVGALTVVATLLNLAVRAALPS